MKNMFKNTSLAYILELMRGSQPVEIEEEWDLPHYMTQCEETLDDASIQLQKEMEKCPNKEMLNLLAEDYGNAVKMVFYTQGFINGMKLLKEIAEI